MRRWVLTSFIRLLRIYCTIIIEYNAIMFSCQNDLIRWLWYLSQGGRYITWMKNFTKLGAVRSTPFVFFQPSTHSSNFFQPLLLFIWNFLSCPSLQIFINFIVISHLITPLLVAESISFPIDSPLTFFTITQEVRLLLFYLIFSWESAPLKCILCLFTVLIFVSMWTIDTWRTKKKIK